MNAITFKMADCGEIDIYGDDIEAEVDRGEMDIYGDDIERELIEVSVWSIDEVDCCAI